MGITANYRQISEFEYASFKRSPLKAYELMFGPRIDIPTALKRFAERVGPRLAKSKAIQDQYRPTGLYERLAAVDYDPDRLSDADRLLFEEQKLKFDALKEDMPEAAYEFSIDKAWQAIHFLLTGHAEGGSPPLAWAVLGGLQLPDHSNYTEGNPLRMLSPQQVQQISNALAEISAEQLLSRASITELVSNDIYRVSQDEEGEREYIRHHYKNLQRYYAEAAEKENGMLLSLT